ncbi:MAG: efflux RND transporter periplasmic adaptor subunit [Armatimonadota bacterium]
MEKRNIFQIILVLIFAALIVIGGFNFVKRHFTAKADKNIISASGRIEGDQYNAASKAGGKVEKIYFDMGDTVKEGELLAVLSSAQLKAQLSAAKKEVSIWQNKLQQARMGLSQTEVFSGSGVEQAQANLSRAQANYNYNEKEYNRYKALFEEEAVAKSVFDSIEAQYIASKAEYDIAAQELKKAKAGEGKGSSGTYEVKQRQVDVKNAEDMLARAKDMLIVAEANLDDAKVYSPINGVVVGKVVEPGEVVGPGTPVLTLVDLNKLYLRVFLPTDTAGKVRLGNKAKIIPDALGPEKFEGVVYKIAQKAEFTPKNVDTKKQRAKLVFEIRIKVLDNKEHYLKPGMPSEASIELNSI